MRLLDGITDSMDMGLGDSGSCDGQGAWHAAGSWGHRVEND